jgi:dipeptidyl aminopeptidase/acylaminoacyl peptidase
MEELAPYTEFRTATLIDWHPTRREMLISTRFGQSPHIHRVIEPGGARTQLTFYPDRVQGLRYRPDGSSFLFSKDIGGGEWYQIYNYDTRTGRAALLTDGKSRNMGALWSPDGAHFAYASTRRNGRDMDIYIGVPEHPEEARRVVEADSGGWEAEDFSPDGKSLAVIRAVSAYEAALFLVDTTTEQQTTLTPRQPGVSYRHARFAPDGKTIYMITNQDSDFEQLAAMDIDTHKVTILRPGLKWDVTTFDLTRDGRRIAYIVNENGSDTLHAMDTATRQEVTLPKLPYGSIGDVRWHANGHDLGFTITSARTPLGCVFYRYRHRQTGALDLQRNRGTGRIALRRAGTDRVEVFRRTDHLRFFVPAAPAVHGAAAGDRNDPWRTGGAVSAGLSGHLQLSAGRIGDGPHFSECARLDRLWEDVSEFGQRAQA